MSEALTEYEEVCRDAQDAGVNIVTKEFTNNWDYIQSCFFALTILTTIGAYGVAVVGTNLIYFEQFSGYGNFATVTFKGRFFCLIFGIIGIPFMLSVLADVGGIFAGILQIAWNKNKNRIKMVAKKLQLEKHRYLIYPRFWCMNNSHRSHR